VWNVPAPFEELPKELLGGVLVSATLDENAEHAAVLIYGPPQIVPFAVDGEKHLVHMPLVPWLGRQRRS